DEHVERDLQSLLLLDLRRRMRVLAGLVVLDDAPRAERVDIDAVDLPRERQAGGQLEPALQLRRGPVPPEEHLEATRNERQLRLRFAADERFQIAPEAVPQLALLQLLQLHPPGVDGLGEEGAQKHQAL